MPDATMQLSKRPGLTLKEDKFVDVMVEQVSAGETNLTQATIDAGYKVKSKAVAGVMGHDALKKPKIRRAIDETLERAGLGLDQATEMLESCIKAGVARKPTNADSIRGLEMAFKLHDAFPATKHKIDQRSISLNLSGKDVGEVQKRLDTVLEEAVKFRDRMGA